jgi:hypothetical protein
MPAHGRGFNLAFKGLSYLGFITETLSVYCAVQTEYLNMIRVFMGLIKHHVVTEMFGREEVMFYEFLTSQVGNRSLAWRSGCLLTGKIALLLLG